MNGTWDVRAPNGQIERVRPQDITTTALLTVEGELDDISGPGQTHAAHDLCSNLVNKTRNQLEAKGAGHYGIFSGRRWRENVYPHVRQFILENDTVPKMEPLVVLTAPATAPASAAPAAPAAPVVAVAAAAAVTGAAATAPVPETQEGQHLAAVTAASTLTKGRRRGNRKS